MTCVEAAELRAYLDGELAAGSRAALAAHLAGCPVCRQALADVHSQMERVASALDMLAPSHSPAVDQAWLHFQQRHVVSEHNPGYGIGNFLSERGEWSGMIRRLFARRALWASVAAALAIVALLSLPPVQAWAGQFLDSFRVRQFAPVSINSADLRNNSSQFKAVQQLLSDQVTMVREPGQPKPVGSQSEAAQAAGMPVRLPTTLPSDLPAQPKLMVSSGAAAKMVINADRLQAILDAAGMQDMKVPSALNGATATIDVPAVVVAQYGTPPVGDKGTTGAAPQVDLSRVDGAGRSKAAVLDTTGAAPPIDLSRDSGWTLTQLRSPTVDVPPGADLSMAGEAMLRLMGMPADQAAHFAKTVDWSSTLVIPVPSDVAQFRDVQVDGVNGVLIEGRQGAYGHFSVLWQKDGVVYALFGSGNYADALAAADSMK